MPYKNKDKQREYDKLWRRSKRIWWWKFKSTLQCSICGEDHPATLQFHHPDSKLEGVSTLAKSATSMTPRLLEEINKCQVLCANCHFKLHFDEWEINIQE